MIGVIITGNGHFASSMLEAAETLIGKKEEVYTLDYHDDKTYEEYSSRLEVLIDDLLTRTENVIVLNDLSTGETYDAVATAVDKYDRVGYACSVSLGLILTVLTIRDQISDPYELLSILLTDGQYIRVDFNHRIYSPRDDSRWLGE